MPKQKITKDMVLEAAFELAREGGMDQVLVKRIAEKLNCSVQPIYSYCSNMGNLRKEVGEKARDFAQTYVKDHLDPEDLFRSTGRAYLQLAGEEPEIFKLFILREREGISSFADLYQKEADSRMAGRIAEELGISLEKAFELHLNLLIYTIGLGTIFSVVRPGIALEEIQKKQDGAYKAFKRDSMK